MLLRNMSILKKNKDKFIFPMKFLQKRKDELYENTMKKMNFYLLGKTPDPSIEKSTLSFRPFFFSASMYKKCFGTQRFFPPFFLKKKHVKV